MSKKTLLLCLCIVATLVVGLGSTLAYLTDTDTKVNTFTVGNVDIIVDEEFEQNSPLAPGATVDKNAQLTNIGATPAWVWMTVAVPADVDPYITLNWAEGVTPDSSEVMTGDDGNEYMVYTLLVDEQLAAGDSTGWMLDSVTLSPAVDYQNGEYVAVVDGQVTSIGTDLSELDVIVSGYATQVEGFDTVEDAYDAYHGQWQDDTIPTEETVPFIPEATVNNSDELAQALEGNAQITIGSSISSESIQTLEHTIIDIDLQDNTLTGPITNNGELAVSGGTLESDSFGIVNNGDATISDVAMNAGNTSNYAGISNAGSTTEYTNTDIVSAGGGIGAQNGAEVVFNSGSVAINSASTSGRYNFYAAGEGTTITINDGIFSFSSTLNQKRAYIYAGDGTTVYVNGGTFGPASTRSGYTAGILTAGTGKVIITGGTFGFDPSTWVADGYQAVKNGSTWTVSAQ